MGDDKLEEVKCVIPDRSYATSYKTIIEDCQENGQFDWTSTGHVSNVGLMAQKAEEYGSHDKTFEIPAKGTVVVTDAATDDVIFKHSVEVGDVWRMCQTKDLPIQDWVKLAVSRARATGAKAIFWLNPARAHDANLIALAKKYLADHDTAGLDIEFMTPAEACTVSCTRARAGLDTISCTGNVLRDYLTDLFPILELGTSAKMLSIVPLLAGGVLLETGAGGSAPKHVEQLLKENHLRWDSLGEYLATAIGFQELGDRTNSDNAKLLGETMMNAVGKWLENNKTPGRKVKQIDNRGSNFYVALYWAEELAAKDPSWAPLAQALKDNEADPAGDDRHPGRARRRWRLLQARRGQGQRRYEAKQEIQRADGQLLNSPPAQSEIHCEAVINQPASSTHLKDTIIQFSAISNNCSIFAVLICHDQEQCANINNA